MDVSPAIEPSSGDFREPELDAANGNMQVDDMSYVPAEMKQHLDFIDIGKDGRLLLGASSLTSRYWMADVWLFERPEHAPDPGQFQAARQLDSGAACGRFVDGLGVRAVVGQDLGVVEVLGWEASEEPAGERRLITHGRSGEHDGAVLALELLATGAGDDPDTDAARAVTGMADGSVKVWDLETLVAEVSYPGAHVHWVSGVSAHPSQPQQLVSCGLDGTLLLWDTRAARPARRLPVPEDGDRPTCCAWCPTDTASVAVGWESGRVTLYNTVSGKPTAAAAQRPRPLHRLRWHPSRPWLAVCGDQTSVQVYSASDRALTSRHEDSLHVDMVRDLAWQPGTDSLFSCGWDRQVHTRAVV